MALALSLAVNGALLGVVAMRVAPAVNRAERPAVNVVLLPSPASRPLRRGDRPERHRPAMTPDVPVASAAGSDATLPSAPGLPSRAPPPVEEQWRVDPRVVSQDAARDALRRDNWRLVCFGLKGVLSTEEKDMCERFWTKGHVPLP